MTTIDYRPGHTLVARSTVTLTGRSTAYNELTVEYERLLAERNQLTAAMYAVATHLVARWATDHQGLSRREVARITNETWNQLCMGAAIDTIDFTALAHQAREEAT